MGHVPPVQLGAVVDALVPVADQALLALQLTAVAVGHDLTPPGQRVRRPHRFTPCAAIQVTGSTACPPTRPPIHTSKWTCGPVALPLAPTLPTCSPASTCSPGRTRMPPGYS